MRILLFFTIGILYTSGLVGDEDEKKEETLLSDVNKKEEDLLDDALFEGLKDGLTFTLDCVTMSKHDHDSKEPSQKQLDEEHEHNAKEAKLEADYMTKHHPLESKEVKKKEANLFTKLNILLHYLNSRGQEWSLREPKDLDFEESSEKHMVFESKSNDSADIKIPANLFYTVGNMKKSIPVHKEAKKPILLTCLESFIVSRLGFMTMQGLSKSDSPVEEKLEHLNRWIKLAKSHYILYLPYISITAPRCHDLLKGDQDDELNSSYSDNNHYKHLFSVCNKMLRKREDDGMLQTYVMLDSELHPDLIKKTIDDKHLFPLLLQEKDSTLRTIHEHHKHEMDWDEFQAAGNMILAELEDQIVKKVDLFLKPGTWGVDLNTQDSKKAEMELIKLFVRSQKKLNSKVVQTVRTVAHQSLDKKGKGEDELKKSMIKFSEKEQEAAKKESSSDNDLKTCMENAIGEVDKDLKSYNDSSQTNIATKLKNFEHDSWMECVSSRILDKLDEVCRSNENYCKTVSDTLVVALENVDPDSTSAIAIENFHYALTVVLLKNGLVKMSDVKKHILKVSNKEIKEMSETPSSGSHVPNSKEGGEESETESVKQV